MPARPDAAIIDDIVEGRSGEAGKNILRTVGEVAVPGKHRRPVGAACIQFPLCLDALIYIPGLSPAAGVRQVTGRGYRASLLRNDGFIPAAVVVEIPGDAPVIAKLPAAFQGSAEPVTEVKIGSIIDGPCILRQQRVGGQHARRGNMLEALSLCRVEVQVCAAAPVAVAKVDACILVAVNALLQARVYAASQAELHPFFQHDIDHPATARGVILRRRSTENLHTQNRIWRQRFKHGGYIRGAHLHLASVYIDRCRGGRTHIKVAIGVCHHTRRFFKHLVSARGSGGKLCRVYDGYITVLTEDGRRRPDDGLLKRMPPAGKG